MRLPNQAPTVTRQVSTIALTGTAAIVPSDCSVFKKVACAGALAACAAVCAGSIGHRVRRVLRGFGSIRLHRLPLAFHQQLPAKGDENETADSG